MKNVFLIFLILVLIGLFIWFWKYLSKGFKRVANREAFTIGYASYEAAIYDEAMKWFLRAANQGDARAEVCIAVLYRDGLGVKQDYIQAMNWYLKAAEKGEAPAMTGIGYLYRSEERRVGKECRP